MPFVSLITVDAVHAEVIREALAGADIELRQREIKRTSQLPLVPREMVEIEVEAEKEQAAKDVLKRLEVDSEEAVLAQAGGEGDVSKSLDDLRIERERSANGFRDPGFVASSSFLVFLRAMNWLWVPILAPVVLVLALFGWMYFWLPIIAALLVFGWLFMERH